MSKGIWFAWPVLAVILIVAFHEPLYLEVRKLVITGPTTIDGLILSKGIAYAVLIVAAAAVVWIVARILRSRK